MTWFSRLESMIGSWGRLAVTPVMVYEVQGFGQDLVIPWSGRSPDPRINCTKHGSSQSITVVCPILGMTEQAKAWMIAWVREQCVNGEARRERQRLKLSEAQVGAVVGTSEVNISRWERGIRLPRKDAALRYAKALRQMEKIETSTGRLGDVVASS